MFSASQTTEQIFNGRPLPRWWLMSGSEFAELERADQWLSVPYVPDEVNVDTAGGTIFLIQYSHRACRRRDVHNPTFRCDRPTLSTCPIRYSVDYGGDEAVGVLSQFERARSAHSFQSWLDTGV